MAVILLDGNAVNSMACMQVRLQSSYDRYEPSTEHQPVVIINTRSRCRNASADVTRVHACGRVLRIPPCDVTHSPADARMTSALTRAHVCRHADEAALVDLWIIYVGEAAAVAQITAAIVDAGGLSLACEAKAAMVSLGEWLAGSPCYELVRWDSLLQALL